MGEENQDPDQHDFGGNNEIPDAQDQPAGPPPSQENTNRGFSTFDKIEGPARPCVEIIIGKPFNFRFSHNCLLSSNLLHKGPIIGEEEEILLLKSAEDSYPPVMVKWWDKDNQPQGIVINKQKEDEELMILKKSLNEATRLVNVSRLWYCIISCCLSLTVLCFVENTYAE